MEADRERVPGTMYGIRPHRHRTWTEAEVSRAYLLATRPISESALAELRRYAQALDEAGKGVRDGDG